MPKVVALQGLGVWIGFVAFGVGVDDVVGVDCGVEGVLVRREVDTLS